MWPPSRMVTGLQVALPQHDMVTWGWRIPFFLALPLGLTAVVLRLRLGETLEHRSTEDQERTGLWADKSDQADNRGALEVVVAVYRT